MKTPRHPLSPQPAKDGSKLPIGEFQEATGRRVGPFWTKPKVYGLLVVFLGVIGALIAIAA